jgi:hypothetical protein
VTGALTIPDGLTVDVGAAGKLDKITGLTIEAGATLAGGNALTLADVTEITVDGTLNIAGAAVPKGNVTVNAGGKVNVSGSGKSLTIAQDKVLNIAAQGAVNLTNEGSMVLTGGAAGTDGTGKGAKLTGEGKVVAGATEIVGGTNGWQAVTGKIEIKAGAEASPLTASITATSGGIFTALAAGATITQATGTDNNLTIANNTVINLAGTAVAKCGEIVLVKKQVAGDTAAKITLADSGAIIKAGSGGETGTTANAALTTGLSAAGATGAVAAANVSGHAQAAASSSTLTMIKTSTTSDNTITGPTDEATANCVISSTLAVAGV